jgi:hypothetical protein
MDIITFLQSKHSTNFFSVVDQLLSKAITPNLRQSLVRNNEPTRSRVEPLYFGARAEEAQRRKKSRSMWQYLWG